MDISGDQCLAQVSPSAKVSKNFIQNNLSVIVRVTENVFRINHLVIR